MRSVIACLLLATLAIGGCDKPSSGSGQGEAAANGSAPEAAALPETGMLDRSHKGEPGPDVPILAPDGSETTLAAFRGKPLLLNLWATWCAPCIAEMPTLDALAVREAGTLQVLVVSQDLSGREAVDPFFAKAKFKALKPYLDPDIRLTPAFAANLPTTILFNSEGKEVWRVSGGMDWAGAKAKTLIAEAG